MISIKSVLRRVAVAVVVGEVGCAPRAVAPKPESSGVTPSQTNHGDTSVRVEAHAQASKKAEAKGGSRISSPCVLHAGEGKRRTRRVRSTDGRVSETVDTTNCAANAECIKEHGKDTPGDGFVLLECMDSSCTCSIEGGAQAADPSVLSFELPEPCASADDALHVIAERCMLGMAIVGK